MQTTTRSLLMISALVGALAMPLGTQSWAQAPSVRADFKGDGFGRALY